MKKAQLLGLATYKEILSQPEAWKQAIEIVKQNSKVLSNLIKESFDHVVFIGCGSTYYLSFAAASLFQELTGLPARGIPSSELLFYPDSSLVANTHTLLVAVSRSGESTETIAAVEKFMQNNQGKVLTITNYDGSSLSNMGAINLIIPAGQEISIAQTRAFTSMYICTVAVSIIFAGREDLFDKLWKLPPIGYELMERYESFAEELGEELDYDRFYFLGSGPRYGLACEANLKMKEMTLTHSEPFHFFEFRHGPKSMVNDSTVINAFLSRSHRLQEEKVVEEMLLYGARTVKCADADADVILPDTLPEEINNVLYMPIMQLIAFYRALAKNLNPDCPTNLDKVVTLDNLGE